MVSRGQKIPGEVRNEEKSKTGSQAKLEERERETKQNSFGHQVLKSKVCHWISLRYECDAE